MRTSIVKDFVNDLVKIKYVRGCFIASNFMWWKWY